MNLTTRPEIDRKIFVCTIADSCVMNKYYFFIIFLLASMYMSTSIRCERYSVVVMYFLYITISYSFHLNFIKSRHVMRNLCCYLVWSTRNPDGMFVYIKLCLNISFYFIVCPSAFPALYINGMVFLQSGNVSNLLTMNNFCTLIDISISL